MKDVPYAKIESNGWSKERRRMQRILMLWSRQEELGYGTLGKPCQLIDSKLSRFTISPPGNLHHFPKCVCMQICVCVYVSILSSFNTANNTDHHHHHNSFLLYFFLCRIDKAFSWRRCVSDYNAQLFQQNLLEKLFISCLMVYKVILPGFYSTWTLTLILCHIYSLL